MANIKFTLAAFVYTARNAVAALALFLQVGIAQARYDTDKIVDWKFHALICKQVVMHLTILATLEKRHGKSAVSAGESRFKQDIAKSVLEHEKTYPFDTSDAKLIADMVFAIRFGLDGGGFSLEHGTAQNQGFDACVSSLEHFDKELEAGSSLSECKTISILTGAMSLAEVIISPSPPYEGYKTYLLRNNARNSQGILVDSIKAELVPAKWGFDILLPSGERIAQLNFDGLTIDSVYGDTDCSDHSFLIRPTKSNGEVSIFDKGVQIGTVVSFSHSLLEQ